MVVNVESVASNAASAINLYLLHSSLFSTSWMASRIIELAEKIPVLLLGSKKVEIRMELQLLMGFLRCMQGMKGLGSALTASTSLKASFISKCRDVPA